MNSPFLRFLIPLAAGIIFQYGIVVDCRIFYVGLILSLIVLVLYFILKDSYSNRWIFALFICFFCFSGGGYLADRTLQKTVWSLPPDVSILYQGVLQEYPVEKKKTVRCRVKLSGASENNILIAIDKEVLVYLPKDSASTGLLPGDHIVFRCRFKPLEPASGKVSFDYDLYLKKQGFAATGFVGKDQWEYKTHSFGLKYMALECRTALIRKIKAFEMDDRPFALGVAIFLGYTNLMDVDLKTSFSSAGISHIIAVSGQHVQIIFIMLWFISGFMGNRKYSKISRHMVVLACIWIFTYITGLSPSVVRAAVMLTLYGVGEMIGKKSLSLNTVYAAAVLMLLYNPFCLFDVSFQLSYAAVISIIVVYPMFEQMHKTNNPAVRYVWGLFCVSAAAQLGTLPLCLYYFHQFPVYFWLANLIVVPLAGPLLIGIVFLLALQSVFILPSWCFLPVEYMLKLVIWVADSVDQLPFSVINGIYLGEIQAVLLYGILFCTVAFFRNRKIRYVYLSQLFLLLLLI